MADVIKITVLPDGLIRTETDPISPVNHQSAADFVTGIAQLAGGTETVTSKHARPDEEFMHLEESGERQNY